MRILTFDPKKEKKVKAGYYKDGIFFREVTDKHFMWKFEAYGMQADVADKLASLGCKIVVLFAPTQTWISKFEDWARQAPKDFGNGKQLFLTLKYMRTSDKKEAQLRERYKLAKNETQRQND